MDEVGFFLIVFFSRVEHKEHREVPRRGADDPRFRGRCPRSPNGATERPAAKRGTPRDLPKACAFGTGQIGRAGLVKHSLTINARDCGAGKETGADRPRSPAGLARDRFGQAQKRPSTLGEDPRFRGAARPQRKRAPPLPCLRQPRRMH